jgi:hypothetical protein
MRFTRIRIFFVQTSKHSNTDHTMGDSSIPQASSRGVLGKACAQLAFEEERDDILSQTPKHIKAVFGQMALAGWSGKAYPALALSPFDVPPGSVREQWMNMFENVRTRAVSRAPT